MRHLTIMAVVAAITAAAPSQSATQQGSPTLPIGPHLIVTGMGMTPVESFSLEQPITEIYVVQGTPVVFCWTADASAYGGTITDYRWGFDIADPADPNQWQVDWTPFDGSETCNVPHTFFFGTHTFTVDVRDNLGWMSRVPIKMWIVSGPLPAEPTTWGSVKALYR